MIKKVLKIVVAMVLFSTLNYAVEVLVANFQGNVVAGIGDKWVAVKKGQMLKENEKIKTLSKSYVLLSFSDGTSVSLSENTELVIKEISNNVILNLDSGRIKSKVKPLQLGQKFEVRTPVSVASIRGTTFIAGYIEGLAELIVEEGKVIWSDVKELDMHTDTKQESSFVEVVNSEKVTATSEGLGEKTVLTEEQMQTYDTFFEIKIEPEKTESGKAEPKEEEKQSEAKEDKKEEIKQELVSLRQEMKEFVRDSKINYLYINEIVQQTKSNDFETARSLTDIHGNLTRIEQTVSRPNSSTIEFVNITKRNNYNYKGQFATGAHSYTVKDEPRVDLLTFLIEFNQKLPEKINEFPSFMVSKGDEIYPKRMRFEISNNANDKIWGEATFEKVFVSGTEKKEKLEGKFQNWLTNGIETYKVDLDYNDTLPPGVHSDENTTSLYFWSKDAIPVLSKDANGNYTVSGILWLQNENYVINNSGKVLDETFFKNVSDPFAAMKEIAFESIIFVRKDNNGVPGNAFFNKNIDLVATPDIVIAMAKSMAPSLANLDLSKK